MTTGVISREFVLPKGSREDFVGEVIADVELTNFGDEVRVREGTLLPERVRRLNIQMVVDTGANMVVVPEDVVERLGLVTLRYVPVEYADGREEQRPVAGMLRITVEGREAEVSCIVGPPGTTPLLGQVALEITKLLVDCNRRRLVPDPESPDKPLYKIYRA